LTSLIFRSQYKFFLYFLATLPEGETYDLVPGTQKAHDYLWNREGVALELTYNYGTEKDDFEGYHAGNEERDGFGNIAVRSVVPCAEYRILFLSVVHMDDRGLASLNT
jgi:hypothetical protein